MDHTSQHAVVLEAMFPLLGGMPCTMFPLQDVMFGLMFPSPRWNALHHVLGIQRFPGCRVHACTDHVTFMVYAMFKHASITWPLWSMPCSCMHRSRNLYGLCHVHAYIDQVTFMVYAMIMHALITWPLWSIMESNLGLWWNNKRVNYLRQESRTS